MPLVFLVHFLSYMHVLASLQGCALRNNLTKVQLNDLAVHWLKSEEQ